MKTAIQRLIQCFLKKKPTVISLAGGKALPVLWSEKTTLAHIREARHICAELVREEEEAVLRRLKNK